MSIEIDELIAKLKKISKEKKAGNKDIKVPVVMDADKIYGISEVTYNENENRVVLW